MITFQYHTKDDHMYGNNRILAEIEPYMEKPIRVGISRTNPLIYALRVIDQCKQRDATKECIHHFTEPSMGFMGHIPTRGKKVISINDAIAPKWYKMSMRERIMAAGYAKFDAVITISESAKADIAEVYRIPEEKIHVAPLGVNTDRFHPSKSNLRAMYNIPQDALVFGTVGNTRPHKNLKFALTVLEEIHKRGELDAWFIRCGYFDKGDVYQRDEMDEIEQWYTRHVINLKYQEDLVAFYNTLNVYFAPSLAEGFDLPVLEAMACGVPVLASKIPIHQEILDNEAVVIGMDSLNRAAACAILVETYYYLCVSQTCREFAEQHPWSRTAERIQEIYENVSSTA